MPPGHWCRPPSMVINSTPRRSAHAAVDVVTGALGGDIGWARLVDLAPERVDVEVWVVR